MENFDHLAWAEIRWRGKQPIRNRYLGHVTGHQIKVHVIDKRGCRAIKQDVYRIKTGFDRIL